MVQFHGSMNQDAAMAIAFARRLEKMGLPDPEVAAREQALAIAELTAWIPTVHRQKTQRVGTVWMDDDGILWIQVTRDHALRIDPDYRDELDESLRDFLRDEAQAILDEYGQRLDSGYFKIFII